MTFKVFNRNKEYKRRLAENGGDEPIVFRSGECNVNLVGMKKQKAKSRYMQDIYTTVVDAKWRYTLLIFISGFILSWLFFGFIYYMITKIHGDDLAVNAGNTPCVIGINSFTTAFLYSLESQHTIGYGTRAITEECPVAIVTLCFQSITGVILQTFMAGLVFAKITRSKSRANTVVFSRNAVICLRDGKLVLMFRIGDLRKSFIVGATVKAQLIRPRRTEEGEQLPFHMANLKFGSDDHSEDLLFLWPLTIVHVIDETSPFYKMDATSILNEKFEMVVYLEGTSESTGTTMQARHSYRNGDVLWGHRFKQVIYYEMDQMNYVVDFGQFDSTSEVSTPLVSACVLDHVQKRNPSLIQNAAKRVLTSEYEQLVLIDPSNFNETSLEDESSKCNHIMGIECENCTYDTTDKLNGNGYSVQRMVAMDK